MSPHSGLDRWGQSSGIPRQTSARTGNDGAESDSRTVLVCDDWPQVREAITAVVAELPGFRVIGEAADSASCLEQVQHLRPDVLILDVSIPGGGAEVARGAKQLHPALHIVVYSGRQDRRTQQQMLAAGADQYVVKTGRVGPLVQALDRSFASAASSSAQGA